VIVGRNIVIPYNELSERQWHKLLHELTFVNGNNEIIECYKRIYTRNQIAIPRGAWGLVDHLDYYDRRVLPEAPKLKFTVELDDVEKDKRFAGQSEAVAAMFRETQGQIIRPPGTGKSQIVLAFIASVGTPSLVIVHTEDILNQWIDYAQEAIPDIEIGIIRGSKYEIGHLTIATIQTLRSYQDKGFWQQFGAVIADEAHHGAAPSWEATINHSPAYYRFGFTASETRADGMHPALKWIFGPVIHKQKFSSPVKLSVVPVRTRFYYGYRGKFDWMPMLNKLVTDDKRNQQIAEVVNEEMDNGNSVLVLSRRIEHLNRIAERIQGETEILTGKRRRDDRRRILADFKSGRLRCLLATQLADEALDVPRLNRVILTHPGKHEGRIIQQIGRAIRTYPGKKDAVIYDVTDSRVSILRRQWSERKRTYRQNKISIKKLGRLL
jgi:superfamily II DNA or RNA helicase